MKFKYTARTYVLVLTTLKNGLCYRLTWLRATENTVSSTETIDRYIDIRDLGTEEV